MANRYLVMGQVFVANGTGVITEVGRHVATIDLNVTTEGNFTFTMANGTTATVASGTATVTASPVTLSAGANTITVTGTGTITLTITIGTAANWDTVNSWSASSGGAAGASIPTSADSVYFDANSFTAALQVLTVDATAYSLDMDWTGVTNSPTLTVNNNLFTYGHVTIIAAMTVNGGTKSFGFAASSGTQTFTTNNLVFGGSVFIYKEGASTLSIVGSVSSLYFYQYGGTVTTNDNTITTTGTAAGVLFSTAAAKTLNLGASVVNTKYWDNSGTTNLTLSANTSTINVSGTGAFAGGTPTGSYNSINLNGTAHTVSGAFTANVLTRNGTVTKTDTLTMTSGTTITVTTFAMIGNSSTNRLLVQSSTLGSAATITATNWTGTANVDIMDITATNAVDLSAITGLSGDAGGNTGITFTTAAVQTWDGTTGSWSIAAKWTSRVPLPQDGVSAGGAGNTITVDMPRIGKSITFTGTPTASLSNGVIWYGSLTLVSGMTYTHNSKDAFFRGRADAEMPAGGWTLNTAGESLYSLYLFGPGGTLSLQSALTLVSASLSSWDYGTFTTNDYNINTASQIRHSTGTATWNLGSSIITITSASAIAMWNIGASGLTLNAGTSTIVLVNSSANAQTFVGGGLTYNDVTVQGAGNYVLTITGSNTFNTFTVDRSVAAKTITGTAGTTQTVNDFVCATSGATVVTLNSTGVAWTLAKAGGGSVLLDYMDISNNTASPTYTFYYGHNSTIGAGVTNWLSGYGSVYVSSTLGLISTVSRYLGFGRIFQTIEGLISTLKIGVSKSIAVGEGLISTISRSLGFGRIFQTMEGLISNLRAGISRSISVMLGELLSISRNIFWGRLENVLLGKSLVLARSFSFQRLYLALEGLILDVSRRLGFSRLFASSSETFPYTFPFTFAGGLQLVPSAFRAYSDTFYRYPETLSGESVSAVRRLTMRRWSGISLAFRDATTDRVDCGNDATLEAGTGSWSVEAWVKIKSSSAAYQYVFDKGGDAAARAGYSLYIVESSGATMFSISDGLGIETKNSPDAGDIRDGIWHHLVGVVDRGAGRLRIYKDGNEVGGGNDISGYLGSITNAGLNLLLGGRAGLSRSLYGLMDEARVYARALSATEIKEHFAGVFATETNVKGVWHFDEGTGVSIADSSGNGNTGTITGAGWTNQGISNTRIGLVDSVYRLIKISRLQLIGEGLKSSINRMIAIKRKSNVLLGLKPTMIRIFVTPGYKILLFVREVKKLFFR